MGKVEGNGNGEKKEFVVPFTMNPKCAIQITHALNQKGYHNMLIELSPDDLSRFTLHIPDGADMRRFFEEFSDLMDR